MSKVILVTGSNSSIGFELVRILAEKGHTVYLASRNEQAGQEAQKSLHAKGLTNVKYTTLDVRDPRTIAASVALISAAHGKLDVLVNNAAISRNDVAQHPSQLSVAVARDVFETNYLGIIETTTAFLPLLRAAKAAGGVPVITNVSSPLGSQAYQSRDDATTVFTAYGNSKAAVNGYTVALANELKKEGFKVNAVSPGLVASRLNDFVKGGRTLEEGALGILPMVLLDDNGPTGKFFNWDGSEIAW
ncbi:Salutaridine reductase [Psilocybe cubensis]|uniref:Salutaridine reductase n=2 Tax=Psilocybe cubensis TaxID=181762 RepID=A0ACB8GRH1_PSICU|nr:Salutaridine reductase [Psilocybe cubensis]KAH9478049.1 Salutaridine reductase [Psilocybe cubensis]